jgi:hypothetical protein
VTDHAYWLSGLIPAGPAGSTGSIDAVSRGFSQGEPAPSGLQIGSGTLSGTNIVPSVAYTRALQTWGPTPSSARADEIDITSTGVATATIDTARAGVDCAVKLNVTSDVPITIRLTGCAGTRSFAPPRCPTATGRVRGTTVGLARLGMTRAAVRRAYRHSSDRGHRYEDFFCLTPIRVRVGYGSPALSRSLSRRERHRLSGHVVWISTSNRRYALHGIRQGVTTLTGARARRRLTRALHIGRNFWYLAPNGASTAVLKVRHGRVEEIGIAVKQIMRGRRAQRIFLKSFS